MVIKSVYFALVGTASKGGHYRYDAHGKWPDGSDDDAHDVQSCNDGSHGSDGPDVLHNCMSSFRLGVN